jgi:hypothetical protein
MSPSEHHRGHAPSGSEGVSRPVRLKVKTVAHATYSRDGFAQALGYQLSSQARHVAVHHAVESVALGQTGPHELGPCEDPAWARGQVRK